MYNIVYYHLLRFLSIVVGGKSGIDGEGDS